MHCVSVFRYANDIEIAQSKRDFELKKAAYDMEVQAKKAEADLAYSLQVISVLKQINSNLSPSNKMIYFIDLFISLVQACNLWFCVKWWL